MLKESSSKASIHFSFGDTDVLLVTLAHLYEYEKTIYITDSHGQYKKKIRLSSIIFEDEIINPLIIFHFIETERQRALRYSRAFRSSKARLQLLQMT